MADPGVGKYTETQRAKIVEMLAAGYSTSKVQDYFNEHGWVEPSAYLLQEYRRFYAERINKARKERYADAIETGLALKEERVARLVEHAEMLEKYRYDLDPKNGALVNEKAWRETLADIASEMGGRKGEAIETKITVTLEDVVKQINSRA